MQASVLPEIKGVYRSEYQDIHSQVLQNVLKRLDGAFDRFFERVKNAETPGYPRFKGRNRYNSFTYPQKGTLLPMRAVSASPRSARSRGSFTDLWKGRSRPAPSSTKQGNGT